MDWPSQPSIVEPGCRLWSSSTVPPRCPSRGTLDLVARGNLFDGDNKVPVEPDSNSQCCISHSFVGGAQKRPVSFRLAAGCHLLPESSPAPATNLVYQLLIPSTLPTFHIPLLGVLWENGFLCLPCTHQLAPGRNAPHWVPAPVGPQVEFQERWFSLFVLLLWRVMHGGMGGAALK